MDTISNGDARSLPAPRRTHLAVLLLCFAGISVYGSLVPFDFESKSFSQALAEFSRLDFFRPSWDSRSDWAANALLFLPIGFLGLGIFQVDRSSSPGSWILGLIQVMAACCVASILLEFSQEWFP